MVLTEIKHHQGRTAQPPTRQVAITENSKRILLHRNSLRVRTRESEAAMTRPSSHCRISRPPSRPASQICVPESRECPPTHSWKNLRVMPIIMVGATVRDSRPHPCSNRTIESLTTTSSLGRTIYWFRVPRTSCNPISSRSTSMLIMLLINPVHKRSSSPSSSRCLTENDQLYKTCPRIPHSDT